MGHAERMQQERQRGMVKLMVGLGVLLLVVAGIVVVALLVKGEKEANAGDIQGGPAVAKNGIRPTATEPLLPIESKPTVPAESKPKDRMILPTETNPHPPIPTKPQEPRGSLPAPRPQTDSLDLSNPEVKKKFFELEPLHQEHLRFINLQIMSSRPGYVKWPEGLTLHHLETLVAHIRLFDARAVEWAVEIGGVMGADTMISILGHPEEMRRTVRLAYLAACAIEWRRDPSIQINMGVAALNLKEKGFNSLNAEEKRMVNAYKEVFNYKH